LTLQTSSKVEDGGWNIAILDLLSSILDPFPDKPTHFLATDELATGLLYVGRPISSVQHVFDGFLDPFRGRALI
jgi:hypothetical protein